MKKTGVILITAAMLFMGTSATFGGAFDGMTSDEKAQAAGVYFEEIVRYISENYVGGEVDVDKLMQGAVSGMTQMLDGYSAYMPIDEYNQLKENEKRSKYSPDFTCVFNESGYPEITEIAVSSENYRAGIRKGDNIRTINGVTTYGIEEEEYYERVTLAANEELKMKISRGNLMKDYSIKTYKVVNTSIVVKDISDLNTTNHTYDDRSIGYIKINTFTSNSAEDFRQAVGQLKSRGVKKLVLDLRGNTGGYVDEAIEVCKQIVPSGTIITAKDKQGNNTVYTSELATPPFERYVVLVDGMTASAAEILASAMQDSGAAKIVGEQTYGKGVMQSVMEFQGLGVVKLTTLEYKSRLGKTINGVGITPDVTVDKILFLDEKDELTGDKVTAALRYIGFKVNEENSNARNIGKFQAEMGMTVTYKLNSQTVNAINLEIYQNLLEDDRILTAGYMSLL